jgi:AbiU2
MDSDQNKNLLSTAKTIADHLAYAWNYSGTLRGLQKYARECEPILKGHEHFISTIHSALWDVLFLKLHHCSDSRKKATGFPKLFKQIRKYMEKQKLVLQKKREEYALSLDAFKRLTDELDDTLQMVEKQDQRLRKLDVQRKVKNWRDQVVAHHTITSASAFDVFSKKNRVSLDEIERLIVELDDILHVFTRPLLSEIFMVSDLSQYAREGVDQLMVSLKKAAEPQPPIIL